MLNQNDKFPVCVQCNLSEEMARCDIEEKTLCGLIICRKCREYQGSKICNLEGCKKPYKKHIFRKNFIDKYRKELNIKFDNQFRVRSQWQQLVLSEEIDIDMVHILAALSNQNRDTYDSHIKKEVKRLVQEIRSKKNTIQSQLQGRKLPIFIKTIQTKITSQNQQYDGSLACGYDKNNFKKGIEQILNCFDYY